MEREPHSMVTERIREFKKLRRQYRNSERHNERFDDFLFNKMLELDIWLAENNFDWRQNYPELEMRGDIMRHGVEIRQAKKD